MAKRFSVICLFMAPAWSCGVPHDQSAVVLTLEISSEDASCGLVYVSLAGEAGGADDEAWGFLTGGRFPHTEEFRTGLEGVLTAEAAGYACPEGECRDARREELLVSRGSAGLVLSHGRTTAATIFLDPAVPSACGNAVVEESEECDPGGPTPQDPCLDDCTYPLVPALDQACGPDDGLVLLPDGAGFAAAWTVGAGDDRASPDGLSLMRFDENGTPRSTAAWNILPPSCLDGQVPVFSAFDPTGWGGGPTGTLLVWRERRPAGVEGLCLTRVDAAAGTDETFNLGESAPLARKSPVAAVDPNRVAVAVLEGNTFFVVVVDMSLGLESDRAVLQEAAAGASYGPVYLAALESRVLASAWQETQADGTVSTWLRRWQVADGRLSEPDPAPILVKQEPSAEARGIELLSPLQDPDGFILTMASAAALETVWIEGEEPGGFDRVRAEGAASSDAVLVAAAALEARSLFVLLAVPDEGGDRCAYTLLEVFGPEPGGGWRPASSWGPESDLGCRAGLVPLGAGRAAAGFITVRETASGLFEGALSVDISR